MDEDKNRVAIITGGTRGIGAAIAMALARRGVRIVINGRHQDAEVDATLRSLKSVTDAELMVGDASEADTARNLVAIALERFGRADYLVPAAGGAHPGRITELSTEQWLEAFQIH